jgi:succinate dehydrogenase assembly factor 1
VLQYCYDEIRLTLVSRTAFRNNAAMDKKDFAMIEHLLRRGHRQLEIYQSEDVINLH